MYIFPYKLPLHVCPDPSSLLPSNPCQNHSHRDSPGSESLSSNHPEPHCSLQTRLVAFLVKSNPSLHIHSLKPLPTCSSRRRANIEGVLSFQCRSGHSACRRWKSGFQFHISISSGRSVSRRKDMLFSETRDGIRIVSVVVFFLFGAHAYIHTHIYQQRHQTLPATDLVRLIHRNGAPSIEYHSLQSSRQPNLSFLPSSFQAPP